MEILPVLLILCMATRLRCQDAPDNAGKEFIAGFMENLHTPSCSFHLSARNEADSFNVTLSGAMSGTYRVSHANVTTVVVPSSVVLSANDYDVVTSKAVIFTAPKEFVVYGLNQAPYTTDAYVAYPTDVLGQEYIISTANPVYKSQLTIFGTANGTSVTVFAPNGNVWKTVALNRGQVVAYASPSDLSGYRVVATEKVAVLAGDFCTQIPDPLGSGACDHLVQMMPPTNILGVEFVVPPLANKIYNMAKITTGNSTVVNYTDADGFHTKALGKQQSVEIMFKSIAPLYITSTSPILVVQYATGFDDGRVGDPFMMVIPAVNQYSSSYTVVTLSNFNNFLNFVIDKSFTAGLRISGKPLAQGTKFLDVRGTNLVTIDYAVQPGSLTVEHVRPDVSFMINVYGWASYDSYGYVGGMRLTDSKDFCSLTNDTHPPDGVDNDCDNRVDEEIFNGRDDDGDGLIDEDLASEIPLLAVPSPYSHSSCGFNVDYLNTSITGMAVAKFVSAKCLKNGPTNLTFTDLPIERTSCSIAVSRSWHLKDGCENEVNGIQGKVSLWRTPDVYEWPKDVQVGTNDSIPMIPPALKTVSCGTSGSNIITYRDSKVGNVIKREWKIEFCNPADTVVHVQTITVDDSCKTNLCAHGSCLFANGTEQCECIGSWTGRYCDQLQTTNEPATTTTTQSTCNSHGTVVCNCDFGYTGSRCEQEIDWCTTEITGMGNGTIGANLCGNNGSCISSPLGAECICAPGYKGQFCDEVDGKYIWPSKRCALEATPEVIANGIPIGCPTDQYCVPDNLNCAYMSCSFPVGWCLDSGDTRVAQAKRMSPGALAKKLLFASNMQCNSHGSASCICDTGYTGANCEHEIDWCLENCHGIANGNQICGQHGKCVSHPGGADCLCVEGYTGEICDIAPAVIWTSHRCAMWSTSETVAAHLPTECPQSSNSTLAQQHCVPDDFNCYKGRCKNPIGWCLPIGDVKTFRLFLKMLQSVSNGH